MSRRPELTALDRRILDCLPSAEDPAMPGWRARDVAEVVIRPGRDRVQTSSAELQEVEEILNGLEAVGLTWNDNGWWRRA